MRAKIGETRHQETDRKCADDPDGQYLFGRAILNCAQTKADPFQSVVHRRGQCHAFFSEQQPTRRAAEQCFAEICLQRLDLMADGGLGNAEFLGRFGEIGMACGGIKGAQCIERDFGELNAKS